MGWETDVSIAKVVSQKLPYHWYKYISLPLKRRLYSQILKSSRFCYWSAIFLKKETALSQRLALFFLNVLEECDFAFREFG